MLKFVLFLYTTCRYYVQIQSHYKSSFQKFIKESILRFTTQGNILLYHTHTLNWSFPAHFVQKIDHGDPYTQIHRHVVQCWRFKFAIEGSMHGTSSFHMLRSHAERHPHWLRWKSQNLFSRSNQRRKAEQQQLPHHWWRAECQHCPQGLLCTPLRPLGSVQ